MSRWFRLYDDLLNDPKVQKLPPVAFKTLINLWCIASKNNGIIPEDGLAYALRMRPGCVKELINLYIGLTLLEREGDALVPHGWQKRQQSSAERTRAYRERKRHKERHSDVLDIETDTERVDKKEKVVVGAKAPYGFRGLVVKLSVADYERWKAAFKQIDLDAELNARDAWLADTPSRQSNWFASTSKYLANRNAEAKARASPSRSSVSASPFLQASKELLEELGNAASD
jgi:hypothetical protein